MNRSAGALGVAAAAFAYGNSARAQQTTVTTGQQAAPPPQTTVVQPAPQPAPQTTVVQPPASQTQTTSAPVFTGTQQREATTESGYAPNRYLLTSGIIVFGVPYLTSVVVGASSNHSGDNHLYVPLAGPWMDMADRGPTNGNDNETANKVLLGVDGVFQAIGALQIIGALLMPETKEVTTVPATAFTPEMHVTPAKMGYGGYGMAAFATF